MVSKTNLGLDLIFSVISSENYLNGQDIVVRYMAFLHINTHQVLPKIICFKENDSRFLIHCDIALGLVTYFWTLWTNLNCANLDN